MKRPFKPFPILYSTRLILRKLNLDDIPSLLNYQSNKENYPFDDMKEFRELDEAKVYIEKMNECIEQSK